MRPRRHSVDSETSSDSWSVIQKNVKHREHSGDEIEFEPSDSEEWDSDKETDDSEKSDDEHGDSLEEFDESCATDDDGGDCEIVNEDEAMEGSGCRYYIPSEKICRSLDLLDAECCSNFDEVIRFVFPSKRDATRAVALIFFVASTALLLARSPRLAEIDGDHSTEVFASGLQSREDLGRDFAPLLRRRRRSNFSETCNRWQVSVWSATPSWSTAEPATVPATLLPAIFNSSPTVEVNSFGEHGINEDGFFSRPTMRVSAISISHYAKPRNVCRQEDDRRRRPTAAFASISDEINANSWIAAPYLLAAPISISRMAKQRRDVCNQQVRREKASPSPRTGRAQKEIHSLKLQDPLKMLTGRRLPRIAYKKAPCVAYKDLKSVPNRRPPKRPFSSKKLMHGPCYSVSPPCIDKNATTKRYKGVKAVLTRSTNRQLATYKKRPPMPSLPRLHRPCVDNKDVVKCWKSLDQRLELQPNYRSTKKHLDWFTRRGQIRADNRRL
ncbi:hypothetical protein NECAME_00280 [Necator americanus]|uniref:Uncharacterized protein n=1 Tax=Necator americanus TaxID=51031 RepID=W2TJX5_NECAM|nr:hypothetical protein NECAME_00280 [Necator americanus]ETN81929.1 hypothetical protein NECAME_00280 [Necator americanus]